MNSIAIWLENNKDNLITKNLEVHVNIWFTGPKVTYIKDYIELRIKFPLKSDNFNTKYIYLYIPYLLQKNDIEDKISYLKDSIELSSALFNSFVTLIEKGRNNQFSKIKLAENSEFYLIELDKHQDIEIFSPNNTYSIIKIKIPQNGSFDDKSEGYIRIRINKFDKTSGMFERIEKGILDSFLTEQTILEFNINSPRKLPSNITNKIEKITFKKIHMFVLLEDFTNIEFSNSNISDSRILEKNIWNKYLNIPDNKPIKKVIAYHWKKSTENEPIKDYNFFIKISRNNNNFWIAILIILLLSIISGLIANHLKIAITIIILIVIVLIIIINYKGE